MLENVNEPVEVLAGFGHHHGQIRVLPYLLDWRGERHKLDIMGLHHVARRGKLLLHVFEFTSGSLKFRLELNTETLEWSLTEVFHDD